MSKYLLVTVVLLVAMAIWRHKHQRPAAPARRTPATPPTPVAMVRCAHCAVHLPQTDAVAHHGRYYCCAQHCALGPR